MINFFKYQIKIRYSKMINHYTKNLSEPWFSFILEGKKTVEGRLYKGDWRNLKEGDIITFYNEDNEDEEIKREFKVEITELYVYSSFLFFLRIEGVENCLPSYTLEEGVKVYRSYYTQEEEEKNGVLAIKFRLI